MTSFFRIGVLVGMELSYGRDVFRGIVEFSRKRGSWRLNVTSNSVTYVDAWLKEWRPDGLVVQAGRRDLVERLSACALPMVNISNLLADVPFPRVGIDDEATGELAARHFLQAGFRRFAFSGLHGHNYSEQRRVGYLRVLNRAGYTCSELPKEFGEHQTHVTDWIRKCPKPIAIFCANDIRGRRVSEACAAAGVQVPEEVALLGVDNDEMLCHWANPPLSSIDVQGAKIGFHAAALLERMIHGEPAPAEPILFAPASVVTRVSSDILAVEDPDVSRALKFIRNHAGDPICVEDVLKEVPMSRRTLERKFQAVLGRNPQEEIRRIHLDRARQLLADPRLTLAEVARQSGFPDPTRLSVVFKKETGLTPGEYRRQTLSLET